MRRGICERRTCDELANFEEDKSFDGKGATKDSRSEEGETSEVHLAARRHLSRDLKSRRGSDWGGA